MNTKQLLESAAQAACVCGEWIERTPDDGYPAYQCGIGRFLWNPLSNDNEALILAGTLGLLVDIRLDQKAVYVLNDAGESVKEHFDGRDMMAAIRLAIVRAAAGYA